MCALVDARDAFDPISAEAAGVKLKHLLWVRCKTVDQALRATDLLIHTEIDLETGSVKIEDVASPRVV